MGLLIKNSLFSSLIFLSKFLSSAVLFIVIARKFSVEDFGAFTYAVSLTGIFLVALDYGYNLYIVKEVSSGEKDILTIVSKYLLSKIILCFILTFVFAYVVLSFVDNDSLAIVLCVLWVSSIFYSFGQYFNFFFRGLNKFEYEMYSSIVLNALLFFSALFLIYMGFGILSLSFVFLFSRLVYLVLSFVFFRMYVGKFRFDFKFADSLMCLYETFPYGIHSFLGVIYLQIDTVLIGYFHGNENVGYYQSAMRLVMVSMIIYEIIVSSFFPILSNLYHSSIQKFYIKGLRFNRLMLCLGFVFSATMFCFSEEIYHVFYSESLFEANIYLKMLSLVVFFRFVSAIYAVLITLSGNQYKRVLALLFSVFVNVFLNIVLIPQYIGVGAVVASIITHLLIFFIYFIISFYVYRDSFLDKKCFVFCLVSLTGTCLSWYAYRNFGFICSGVFFILMFSCVSFVFLRKDFIYLGGD